MVRARLPNGQFLNWQPGKLPSRTPDGFTWTLEKGNDFVLQLHLHPTGKPETVQSSIGLYFTDQPPVREGYKIILDNPTIDIAPGRKDYVLEDSYTLPVDVDVTAIFPHAHYLAKQMHGWAERPDGTRQWLFRIADWDFNWQGDYRFAKPIFLPKGIVGTFFSAAADTRSARRPAAAGLTSASGRLREAESEAPLK